MTREEHLAWCKQRAMQEFDYYAKEEGIPSAVRNAGASMLSDVSKHADTKGLQQTCLPEMRDAYENVASFEN